LARLAAIAFCYCLVFSLVREYVFHGRRLNYYKEMRSNKIAKNMTEYDKRRRDGVNKRRKKYRWRDYRTHIAANKPRADSQ